MKIHICMSIIEVSPWVFYENNKNSRWNENITYRSACKDFYEKVNREKRICTNLKWDNPYTSIPYFLYNIKSIKNMCSKAFKSHPAKVSDNTSELADYPDVTIRYASSLELPNPKRLEKVKSTNRGVTYHNIHKMKWIGKKQKLDFERLIYYLLGNNIEITVYLQPFSVTQCKFIYENNTNPVFGKIEKYLTNFSTRCNVNNIGKRHSIRVIGSYNANNYNLSDEAFIDFMRLDKSGTAYVWKSFRKKWLSIGDSIAYGMISNIQGTLNKQRISWTQYLADAAGYDLDSQEVRGMGYIRIGPNHISFEQILQKLESMTEDYSLITVALGINDYKEEGVSLANLQVVIDDSIQRLMKKFPKARVVYITPFNSARYGNQLTNYCCGYEFSGRTLNSIAALIKQRCSVYGVQCVNCTDNFLTNSEVEKLLQDKLHPSRKGHIYIAKKIYRRRLKQFL